MTNDERLKTIEDRAWAFLTVQTGFKHFKGLTADDIKILASRRGLVRTDTFWTSWDNVSAKAIMWSIHGVGTGGAVDCREAMRREALMTQQRRKKLAYDLRRRLWIDDLSSTGVV
jgi:hypothetical protein